MNKLRTIEDRPWYAEGLPFACTGCGRCCGGGPGFVFVENEEMQKMADHLKLELEVFVRRYVRKIGDRYSLKEFKNYDCVFLKDKKCMIYTCRPKQCRTFPFWTKIMASRQAWEETAKTCEGIADNAPVVPLSVIEAQLNIQNQEKL